MSNYKLETPISIQPSGILRLFQTNSTNAIDITSSSASTALDFTLPSNAGTAGQFLQRTSATSTAWTTGTATQTGNTMPIAIRLAQGNLPSIGFSISSATFTVITVFLYGGSVTSQPFRNVHILFTVTPAGTAGQLRLRDVTGGFTLITTVNCSSSTATFTINSGSINPSLSPTVNSIMEISGLVTTATTITFHSILFT